MHQLRAKKVPFEMKKFSLKLNWINGSIRILEIPPIFLQSAHVLKTTFDENNANGVLLRPWSHNNFEFSSMLLKINRILIFLFSFLFDDDSQDCCEGVVPTTTDRRRHSPTVFVVTIRKIDCGWSSSSRGWTPKYLSGKTEKKGPLEILTDGIFLSRWNTHSTTKS